jgi:putative mannosyl-glycoprotein endo-beta-N-acetylglucosaminidase
VLLVFIIGSFNIALAETGRLVDIPVPPESSGYTDFTEEEAKEKAEEFEKNKNDLTTAQDYVGKSSNNYLKMLKVEGYELTPEFNRQNDSYTIYVKDDSINNFNVIAETDNEKARVEGIGNINISSNDRKINVKVTAENGNINMYTINVENESNKPKDQKGNILISFIIIIVVATIVISIIFVRKKKD